MLANDSFDSPFTFCGGGKAEFRAACWYDLAMKKLAVLSLALLFSASAFADPNNHSHHHHHHHHHHHKS
ncbi:MAG TPA: hypothetical protein VGD59_04520 [Acidisarcina sp.]